MKNRFTNILDKEKRQSGKNVLLLVVMCVFLMGSLVACVYEDDEVNAEQTSEEQALQAELQEYDQELQAAKEHEQAEKGKETGMLLLENPGTLQDVSNRNETENFALLDMNMDGIVEQITLQLQTSEYDPFLISSYEILLNGQSVIQNYVDNFENSIYAVSLDGREILIALYEDGPSADPYTRIFRYEDGGLVEVGAFGADIRECKITEDGIISGTIRRDVIETSFIHMSWQMNEDHRLEEIPQDAYDFVRYDEREGVMLLEDLILHNEPNGGDAFGISPQEVNFLQVSGDWRWVLLETADGVRGWFEVEDSIIVELDKQAWEVFEGLRFAG